MELAKVMEIALSNQKSLTAFDEWAEGIERRVVELEKGKDIMVDVRMGIQELTIFNRTLSERLQEMKQALDNIIAENKLQHGALGDRIKVIEDAPGDKWNKLSWMFVSALVGLAIGYLTKIFAP